MRLVKKTVEYQMQMFGIKELENLDANACVAVYESKIIICLMVGETRYKAIIEFECW